MIVNLEIIKISSLASEIINYDTLIFKVTIPKKLEMENSSMLWVLLKTIIEGGVKKILINMKDVEYIDSSGIGTLINAVKLTRKKNVDIVLSNVSVEIKKIFNVVSLQDFITLFPSEVEAINHFRFV
jgi:anti-anti-sigma factor